MAHARSYLRTPEKVSAPVYETRPATEADCRKVATRLIPASMDEVTALSKFQPVSFLLQNMARKRVIVDWDRPDWPVAIFDIAPVESWNEAHVWVGLTEKATDPNNSEAFNRYLRSLFDQLNGQHRQLLHHVAQSNFALKGFLEQCGFIPYSGLSHYGVTQVEYLVMRRALANV